MMVSAPAADARPGGAAGRRRGARPCSATRRPAATPAAHYLVRDHPELFDGVRYAIGEDGGASIGLGGRRLHPIVVAEKRACWVRVTLRGPGGHASRVAPESNPMRQLNRLLTRVESRWAGRRKPTPAVRSDARRTRRRGRAGPLGADLPGAGSRPDRPEPARRLPERDGLYLRSVLQHSMNATVSVGASPPTCCRPSEPRPGRPAAAGSGLARRTSSRRCGRWCPTSWRPSCWSRASRCPSRSSGRCTNCSPTCCVDADPDGVPMPMIMTASTDARLFPQLGISLLRLAADAVPGRVNYRGLMHSAGRADPGRGAALRRVVLLRPAAPLWLTDHFGPFTCSALGLAENEPQPLDAL